MLSPPETKILSVLVKSPEKQKLNFSRSALFHMKTGVCLKYFDNDCSLIFQFFKCYKTTKISRFMYDPYQPDINRTSFKIFCCYPKYFIPEAATVGVL